ncbi:MAG TPA: hypothetical protein VNX01_06290 [Bacteroidia bacterium]|nr:hypothetical protein [Bacteroidia bacterium]
MTKITFLSVGLFCLFSFNKINAQNHPSATNSSQTKENSSWAQPSQKTKEEKPYTTPPINENDSYMGRTEEFLHVMVIDKLPTDFPKYEKNMGLRYYNNLVDNYFEQHLDLLQERYKQKILQSKQH